MAFGALVLLSVPALALALFGGNARALFAGPAAVGEFRVLDGRSPAQDQTPATAATRPSEEPTEVEFKNWENTNNTSRFH